MNTFLKSMSLTGKLIVMTTLATGLVGFAT